MSEFLHPRFPPSEAVRALGLASAPAARFARRLDRTLADHRIGRTSLREAVREVAAQLAARGLVAEEVATRLERVVVEHARERGWTEISVLTGRPRAADTAAQVARWATLACRDSLSLP